MRGRVILPGFGVDRQKPDQACVELIVVDDSHAASFTLAVSGPAYLANATRPRDDISCFGVVRKPRGEPATLVFRKIVRPTRRKNGGFDQGEHPRNATAKPYALQVVGYASRTIRRYLASRSPDEDD